MIADRGHTRAVPCALPRRGGLRRARRRPRLLRGLRRRTDDVPALSDRADLHSRLWKAQVPVPLAPLPRRHIRPARQRALRPADDAGRLSWWEFVADGHAVLEATGRRKRSSAGSATAAAGHSRLPRPARRGARRRRDRALRAEADAVPRELPALPRSRAARYRRGLGQMQHPLLAPRLARLPRVLLLAADPGAAFNEADRGLRSLGARRGARSRSILSTEESAGALGDRRRGPGALRAGPLPGARDPRRPRQLPDARACGCRRRADAAGRSSRWRAPATCRRRAIRSR